MADLSKFWTDSLLPVSDYVMSISTCTVRVMRILDTLGFEDLFWKTHFIDLDCVALDNFVAMLRAHLDHPLGEAIIAEIVTVLDPCRSGIVSIASYVDFCRRFSTEFVVWVKAKL